MVIVIPPYLAHYVCILHITLTPEARSQTDWPSMDDAIIRNVCQLPNGDSYNFSAVCTGCRCRTRVLDFDATIGLYAVMATGLRLGLNADSSILNDTAADRGRLPSTANIIHINHSESVQILLNIMQCVVHIVFISGDVWYSMCSQSVCSQLVCLTLSTLPTHKSRCAVLAGVQWMDICCAYIVIRMGHPRRHAATTAYCRIGTQSTQMGLIRSSVDW